MNSAQCLLPDWKVGTPQILLVAVLNLLPHFHTKKVKSFLPLWLEEFGCNTVKSIVFMFNLPNPSSFEREMISVIKTKLKTLQGLNRRLVDRRSSRRQEGEDGLNARGVLTLSPHCLPSSTRLLLLRSWSLWSELVPKDVVLLLTFTHSHPVNTHWALHLLSAGLWDKCPGVNRAQSLPLGNSQDNRGVSWVKR